MVKSYPQSQDKKLYHGKKQQCGNLFQCVPQPGKKQMTKGKDRMLFSFVKLKSISALKLSVSSLV